MRVRMPHNFVPRDYQMPFWTAMEQGCKRASIEWHRRAGKDMTCLHWMATAMCERVGVYYHIYPEYAHGRRALWNNIDNDGRRFVDAFPPDLIRRRVDQEMLIELVNGSIYQVTGSDTLVRTGVGPNPVGVIWSEYSLTNPAAPPLYRPILVANKGWEIYNFTPRGNNHATRQHDMALGRPGEWFAQTLINTDTGIISDEEIEAEIANGMDRDVAMQEYKCSRVASLAGAYYGRQMQDAGLGGRFTIVPHDPDYPVLTGWDIGVGDPTAIWFVQVSRTGQWRVIDHLVASGEPAAYYAEEIDKRRRLGWRFGTFYGPHDLRNRDKGNAISLYEQYEKLGVVFDIVDQHDLMSRVTRMRAFLPRMYFDAQNCSIGIEDLKGYTKPWDKVRNQWRDGYEKNGCQHSADALGYLVMGYSEPVDTPARSPRARRDR